MTKRPWAIHPFLLAPLPTLLLYSRNLHTVDASEALTPVALSLVATVAAFLVLRACRLDSKRAALIVSACLMLFFAHGHAIRISSRLGVGPDREHRENLALALEAVGLASVVGLALRKPEFARSLNGPCNAASMALAGLTLAGIANREWTETRDRPSRVADPAVVELSPPTARRPDVYFLVLDAYGRSDVLEQIYGFDNSGFLRRLEGKGFVVARSSTANYCQTALSLAATLNVRYLDDLAGSRSTDRLPLKRLITDNAVFRAFRSQGYRLVTFATGFDATDSIDADLMLAPPSHLGTFHALVADQTPLWLLLGRRAAHEPHRMHRDRVLKVFEELPAASHPSTSPTFTFAHVVAPHPPFVFGADGSDVSGREAAYSLNDSDGWRRLEGHSGPDDYARRYRDQVAYLTDRVERAVDRILATSPTPPIIIIQGDHGPGSHFDAAAERPNDLRERMSILNACYLPDAHRAPIADSITPINTIRLVLDRCFGANLGPLPDRNFYSAYQSPYAFIEVTDELKRPAE